MLAGWMWPWQRTVVLTDASGTKRLVYYCDHIASQVETPEEIQIMIRYLPRVIRYAQRERKLVTLRALWNAYGRADMHRLEYLIVENLCEQKLQPRGQQ